VGTYQTWCVEMVEIGAMLRDNQHVSDDGLYWALAAQHVVVLDPVHDVHAFRDFVDSRERMVWVKVMRG
jgi:hypothetical protein